MCDVFADGIKENPAAPHHFSPEISDWPRIIVPTELLSFPSDKVNVPRRFLLFTDIPEKGKKTKIPHQLTVKFTARIEDCHLLEIGPFTPEIRENLSTARRINCCWIDLSKRKE